MMTRRTLLTLVLGTVSLGAVVVHGRNQKTDPQSVRVMLVGNGMLEEHNLPRMLRKLAASGDPAIEIDVQRVTERGATLHRHRVKGRAERLIREGGFDFVVIQEQSMLPLADPDMMRREVEAFAAMIRATGAKPILMSTRAPSDKGDTAVRLADVYDRVSRSTGVPLAPAGESWALARTTPGIRMDNDEGSGGNPAGAAGAYLSACVLYETLTSQDCRGLSSLGLVAVPPRTAARLQVIAHDTVQGLDPTYAGRR